MRFLNRWLKFLKKKLWVKFVFSFLAISLVPLLIFGVSSGHLYVNEITNRTISFNTITMKNAAEEINAFISDIEALGSTALGKQGQQSIKNLLSADSSVKINAIMELDQLFEAQIKSLGMEGSINMISVVGEDGRSLYENTGTVKNSYNFFEMDWFYAFSNLESSTFFVNPHPMPYVTRYQAHASQEPSTFSYLRKIVDMDNPSRIHSCLIIDFSVDSIAQILQPLILSEHSNVTVVDPWGNVIYTLNTASEPNYDVSQLAYLASKPYDVTQQDNNDIVRFVHQLKYTGWYVICENPSNLIGSDTQAVVNAILKISLLVFFVTVIASFFLAHKIVVPVSKLKSTMLRVRNGDMKACATLDTEDEIGELGDIFNEMLTRINGLVDEVYKTKIAEQEARIHALESQINPHFLFNTLENIRSIADVENVTIIEHMTTALSNMFRYSMRFQDSLVPIQTEIAHVKDYLYIIQIRYNHSIKVVMNFQPSIFAYRVVKLILQPIIENSITHGLSKKDSDRQLFLSATVDADHLIFVVRDNGAGMSSKKLLALQACLSQSTMPDWSLSGSSIGISNVNDRIRLRYGNQYGLFIESQQFQGTTVTIKLPLDPLQI